MKKKKQNMWLQICMIILFTVGALIALYPFYINALNNFIDRYRVGLIAKESEKENAKKLKALEEKNKRLKSETSKDPFTNAATQVKLDLKKHQIGKVIIPKIDVDIPLFDKTTSKTLQYGAAVLDGTSYPVGGKGTHSVVSSHRGLPERKLFTDLNKLKKGDLFIFEVYGKKLAYKIDKIQTVLPTDTSVLAKEPERDLASLLTCTPYMLNTHRLVLTGHRVPYTAEIAKKAKDATWRNTLKQALILGGCLVLFGLLLYLLFHTIYLARLKKIPFDLCFYCLAVDGSPLAGKTFGLYDKKGKYMLKRDGVPYQATSDQTGRVCFTELPGGLYGVRLKEAPRKMTIRAGTKKLKQTKGKLYPRKSQSVQIEDETQMIKWYFK